MEIHVFLLQIAAILMTARIFSEVAARLNTPRVIGELAAGIVLGPSLFNLIEPSEPVKLLAEIGIILLLFEVGLETDIGRLIRAGSRSIVLALTGFVMPFGLGFLVAYHLFDLPLLAALFLGGTLTATSIGITVRVLSDMNRQSSREGQIVLGAAVLDDIMGVILLAVLYEFAISGSVSAAHAGKIIVLVVAFFFLAPVAAKLLSLLIKRFHDFSEAPGVIPTALVALVLSFASVAHFVGAPELLGGFAAGIALSRRFFLPLGLTLRVDSAFTTKMHDEMKPIIQLFTPIFFVMVGLSLDLSAIDWGSLFIWLFAISLAFVAVIGKLAGGLPLPESMYTRLVVGIAMVPRGEVGLVFAELGRTANIFDNEVYAALIIVIAYTTLMSPYWIKQFYRRFGRHMDEFEQEEKPSRGPRDGPRKPP